MVNGSIVQMLVSGKDDLAWFESNLAILKFKHNNQFIAFHNKQVIETDASLDNLMKKLENKNIDTSNIFIKFISKVKAVL